MILSLSFVVKLNAVTHLVTFFQNLLGRFFFYLLFSLKFTLFSCIFFSEVDVFSLGLNLSYCFWKKHYCKFTWHIFFFWDTNSSILSIWPWVHHNFEFQKIKNFLKICIQTVAKLQNQIFFKVSSKINQTTYSIEISYFLFCIWNQIKYSV